MLKAPLAGSSAPLAAKFQYLTADPTTLTWKFTGIVPGGDDVFATALRGMYEPATVYAHVPFCKEQCWFCGCNTVITKRRGAAAEYLDDLAREMRLTAAAAIILDQFLRNIP